ncbi:MAG: helix-turn-helix transcriptional regulator, partial [Clostridia bacterium]|nr:helix-turn-helix transcriptional regulator [Clostridia bacterium]
MFASRISKGNLISIVGICFSGMNLIKFNDQNISDLKKLISFCSENYTKHLSLDLIAQELNMSRTNVSKFFSEGLQKNFYDFINMFRIAHASQLLETSSGSITEIAMNAGFEN